MASERPAFDHAPPARPRGIGPFSVRQLTTIGLVVVLVAAVLRIATTPVANLDPGATDFALPTQFVIGSAVPGLGDSCGEGEHLLRAPRDVFLGAHRRKGECQLAAPRFVCLDPHLRPDPAEQLTQPRSCLVDTSLDPQERPGIPFEKCHV